MADFPELIDAQLRGATVRLSPLIDFDFRSGPLSIWQGFGELVIGSTTYKGMGELGSVSAASAGPGQVVEELTLSLSGSPRLLDRYIEDSEETSGREMQAKFCFFDIRKEDESGVAVDWSVLDEPFEWFWGIMGPLIIDNPPVKIGEQRTRTLTVRAANAFINRRKPPMGFWSHRDQTGRGDGTDRLFIRASQMANKTVRWPNF